MSEAEFRPNRRTTLLNVRRVVQLVSLALWLSLFVLTRHQVLSVIPPDLFLMTDPLVAALTMGAAHIFVPAMLASLVLVAIGLILGRVFCGWICPLGTLLDGMAVILRPPAQRFKPPTHEKMQRWKYFILAFIVFGALLSSQWVYLLDPLVVLFRGLASGVYPVLAPDIGHQQVAFLPLGLLAVILLLTAITPRFFCRYLCPLGAFYGLLARAPLLRRRVKGCDACSKLKLKRQCVNLCRMGAIPPNPHRTLNHECIRCFTGRSICHLEAIRFEFIHLQPADSAADRRKRFTSLPSGVERRRPDTPLQLSRRGFLVASASGLVLAPIVSRSAFPLGDSKRVIRPPRVLDEETFADQCVRCGMCLQACPTQTLQLLDLQSGLAGFWTPAITPRVNGCIAECNACSVVCPTRAIPDFGKAEADKWAVKMGTAVLEKNRCISYTENLPCAKCIKICPTKAFVNEPAGDGRPLRPAGIDYGRCVGCGLCEYACGKIVFGQPAVITYSHGRGQPTVLAMNPTSSISKVTGGPSCPGSRWS